MRVLSLSYDEILHEVKALENQTKQIKHSLLKYCWHMRGGLTYEESFFLGFDEREIISDIIKDNMETTKKTQLPYF